MTGLSTETEVPTCPGCDYLLTGLTSQTCPECGATLGPDLSVHLPSRRPTPWSPRRLPWPKFLHGLLAVITRPVRTLAACNYPARVTAARAVTFAATVFALPVLAWPAIRDVGCALSLLALDSPSDGLEQLRQVVPNDLRRFSHWMHLWQWEAWSLLRWWALFGLLTLVGALLFHDRRSAGESHPSTHFKRLLLFTPWFAILELTLLAAVSVREPRTLPEPSTIWPLPYGDRWMGFEPEILWNWTVRSAVPLPLIGFLFCRAVLRWPARRSIAGAIVVTLLGIPLSPIWTGFYETLFF